MHRSLMGENPHPSPAERPVLRRHDRSTVSANIPDRLTGDQRQLLEWIADGSPAGRYQDYAHRISARALSRRGLVRLSGRGPTWHAEIASAGRQCLVVPSATVPEAGPHPTEPPEAPSEPRARRKTKTERLVADLLAADGMLRLPAREGQAGPGIRQRAYAAQAAGLLPEGMALTARTLGDEIELRLAPGAHPERERIAEPPRDLCRLLIYPHIRGVRDLESGGWMSARRTLRAADRTRSRPSAEDGQRAGRRRRARGGGSRRLCRRDPTAPPPRRSPRQARARAPASRGAGKAHHSARAGSRSPGAGRGARPPASRGGCSREPPLSE
jgi:hypothetical protein